MNIPTSDNLASREMGRLLFECVMRIRNGVADAQKDAEATIEAFNMIAAEAMACMEVRHG